ncbi:MAG: hypothetical protein V3R78_10185 [Thermodesulfobacteriota bacterium]
MLEVRNINIHEDGRGKRGGTAIFSAASTRNSQLTGVIDFTLASGTQFVVTTTTEGEVWKDNATQLNSGNLLKSGAFTTFSIANDKVYICDGGTTPQTWDGAAGSTSDLAAVPNDWTGVNFPTQIIIHGSGNSERGWALGLPSNPHTLYFTPDSAGGDLDFTDGTIDTINIETGDGFGLVGGVDFGDRLIIFGKNNAYVINDTSLTSTEWGYTQAQWEGGVAHSRLIIKTTNDVVCMMDDGNIYSITAVQSYGDYKQASITKPSWIDKWIRENTDLSKINQFHGLYDPELRRIYIFVVRNGQTDVDTALVYNVDRGPEEGWTIHDNRDSNSGYSASCAAVVRRSPASHHSQYVYTGDGIGNVWELEESAKNDNNNAYYAGFKTPRLVFDNARATKKYVRGFLVTEEKGSYNVYINIWIDDVAQTQQSVDLSGAGAVWGTMVWGSFTWAGGVLVDKAFDIGAVGKRIQLEVFNSSVDEDFFLSEIQVDHLIMGNRPS